MVELKQALVILETIINDRTVPKNIRGAVENSKKALNDDSQPEELRISTALHILDEIINDPNMPVYTRTQIWNVVSILEQLRKELKSL
ncbi:MAG: UPF0147 family protein [Candidatus Aenigmatarchaeota archaeon]